MAFVSMFFIFLIMVIGVLIFLCSLGITFIRVYRRKKKKCEEDGGKKPSKIWLFLGGMSFILPISCVILIVGLFIKSSIEKVIYDNFIDRWKNTWVSDTTARNDVIKEFIYAADHGDKEAIKSMFTKRIQNDAEFEEQIEAFLAEYPGGLYGLEFDSQGGISDSKSDYGKVIANFYYDYEVEKDGETFYVSFGACYQDSYDEAKVGLKYFHIMSEKAMALEYESDSNIDTKDNPIYAQINVDGDFDIKKLSDDLWIYTPMDRKLSKEQIADVLNNSYYLSDVVEIVGEPNAHNKKHGEVLYELEPENGKGMYAVVRYDDYNKIISGLTYFMDENNEYREYLEEYWGKE